MLLKKDGQNDILCSPNFFFKLIILYVSLSFNMSPKMSKAQESKLARLNGLPKTPQSLLSSKSSGNKFVFLPRNHLDE